MKMLTCRWPSIPLQANTTAELKSYGDLLWIQQWVGCLMCYRTHVPSKTPLSCQRFSSGGSLGKLFPRNHPLFSAPVYSKLYVLLSLMCVTHLPSSSDPSAGLLWKDTAPRWRRRTCGPSGRRTRHARSSLSCSRTGQLNALKSKSKS